MTPTSRTTHVRCPVEEVARECERDPAKPKEREEIELALRWVLMDELAAIAMGAGWLPVRRCAPPSWASEDARNGSGAR